jgi:ElaB/YqjD/DUF883 family membrane-anchored ribosome-binding protein
MDKTKEQIRHEIEETRLRMGDTVDALLYRADVAGRTKESLNHSREKALETLGESRDVALESLEKARERALEYNRDHPAETRAVVAGLAVLAGLGIWAARRL